MLGRVIPTKRGFTDKRCPKCGGNVYIDLDLHDWFEKCLQCGHTLYLPYLVKTGARDIKGTVGQPRGYTIVQN